MLKKLFRFFASECLDHVCIVTVAISKVNRNYLGDNLNSRNNGKASRQIAPGPMRIVDRDQLSPVTARKPAS
jgi:hypothetical protein